MFPLKIYDILMGYSGKLSQKHPSIGNFQKNSSKNNWENWRKNTCGGDLFLFWSYFFIKETPAEVFSCEFFKFFHKTFIKEQLRVAASMTSEFISTDKSIFQAGNKATSILMSLLWYLDILLCIWLEE